MPYVQGLKINIMCPKRVLIIDDEEVVREIVQGCFEDVARWEVITAVSGQEGLQKTLADRPDAIVLDVMMPEMNGITFLQRLKANPATQSIPVVLLTAKVDLVDPDRWAALGAVGAIAKPFDPIELVNQVATFLDWEIFEE